MILSEKIVNSTEYNIIVEDFMIKNKRAEYCAEVIYDSLQ